MALMYPEKATDHEQSRMLALIKSFSWMYPCSVCATDFRDKIVENPPKVGGREEFSLWLCEQHNLVNLKLGKSEFNCTMRRLKMMYGGEISNEVVKKMTD